MNKFKYIVAGLGSMLTLLVFIAQPAFAVNLINNGSFEQNPVNGPFITVNSVDSSTIPGWTVASGNVDQIGTYWQASEGTQSIDMNGDTAGSISQNIPTMIGHIYKVTFDLSGNPDGDPSLKTLTADVGGTPEAFNYDTANTGNSKLDMKWTHQSFTFKATSTTTPLTFTSTTANSNFGPAIDNVVVTDVTTTPTSFNDCRNGGYQNFVNDNNQLFTNEGLCIAYVARHLHRTDGSVGYTAYSLSRHGQWGIANDGSSALGAVGAFAYTDSNHNWYVVSAKDLQVSGNKAWFAGQVTSANNPSWVGNWLFAEVQDNSPDIIWGSFTDKTTAEAGVASMSNPADGPFTVTTGNLTVH